MIRIGMPRPTECAQSIRLSCRHTLLDGGLAGTFEVILCIILSQLANGFTGTAVTNVRTSNVAATQYLTIINAFLWHI